MFQAHLLADLAPQLAVQPGSGKEAEIGIETEIETETEMGNMSGIDIETKIGIAELHETRRSLDGRVVHEAGAEGGIGAGIGMARRRGLEAVVRT